MLSLAADGLSMRYGRHRLFEGLSFEVAPGAPLAVTGTNGAGKSTLLRVLAGLLTPLAGAVRLTVGGTEIAARDLPRTVGFVAPALALYDPLTAREHLDFLSRARGIGAADADAHLDAVGLAGRADEPVSTFSTGMRQRLRLATALLHDPPALLLDEPGATLDAGGRALVARLVADERRIVVVATNDPAEAALCARTLALGG